MDYTRLLFITLFLIDVVSAYIATPTPPHGGSLPKFAKTNPGGSRRRLSASNMKMQVTRATALKCIAISSLLLRSNPASADQQLSEEEMIEYRELLKQAERIQGVIDANKEAFLREIEEMSPSATANSSSTLQYTEE